MRTVLKNQPELAHAWANQIQAYASCGPLRFSGEYAYSYNTAIARLVKVKGHIVALIDNRYYSSTTCKHRAELYRASTHHIQLGCSTSLDLDAAILDYQDRTVNFVMKNTVEANRPSSWSDIKREMDEFNRIAITLGYSHLVLNYTDDFTMLHSEHYKYRAERNTVLDAEYVVRHEKKMRERQEKERIEREQALPVWEAGGPSHYSLRSLKPERIRVKEGYVETTGGASVPFQAALVLLGDLNARHTVVGKDIHGFRISKVDGDLITIGCHTLSIEQCSQVILNRTQGENK